MEAAKLNQSYIPKQILKKTQINNINAILSTNSFDKTGGNPYIEFDPAQIKFNGYQLGKASSAVVKIINKSPIPQRIHILTPTQPGFSIKLNKKGPIAAGMSENITINFISDVYKYQYDVVKVNTETGNFVIPIYAYPSIPKLYQIFPKIIDFGAVNVNESSSYMYPIPNPIPMDFPFEFKYLQESPAFIITPIKGSIAGNSVENIEITFIPSQKKTFSAQVLFSLNQFDFQAIKIKILGNGQQKRQGFRNTKRIKSSKLNPLVNKNETKKSQSVLQGQQKVLDSNISQKKSFIRSRTSYPKLLKKVTHLNNSLGAKEEKIQNGMKKQEQRQYNSQFTKVQQLDKEKEIKFIQYLGDKAMNQEELEFENNLALETTKARHLNLKQYNLSRRQVELKNDAQVDLSKFDPRNVTWDVNLNNDLKIRKQKLLKFVKAGSKIIAKYRLLKRLAKIKQFLSDCHQKQDVQKKIQEDYAKSKEVSKNNKIQTRGSLNFNINDLQPTSFLLQFKDDSQSINKTFQPQGSTKFDDDKILQEIKSHETETLYYGLVNFPSDFIYLTKLVPSIRFSAEQQYPLKSPSLPQHEGLKATSIYQLPLKTPTHQFIYNNFQLTRYKTLNQLDERDPETVVNSMVQHIEDEYEGWSKGDINVLKKKFQRNMGCQFSGISLSSNNFSDEFAFLGEIDKSLPRQIGNSNIGVDDILQEGDSDEEKVSNIEIQKIQTLIGRIEQNQKVKQRREKKDWSSYENSLLVTMQKNLEGAKIKNLNSGIDKISEYNKWAQKDSNKVLI